MRPNRHDIILRSYHWYMACNDDAVPAHIWKIHRELQKSLQWYDTTRIQQYRLLVQMENMPT